MANMLQVIATLVSKQEAGDDVRKLLMSAIDQFGAEPGCESYVLLEDRQRPGRFMTFETWVDEKALTAHMSSPAMKALTPQLKDLLEGEIKQDFLSVLASR